MLKGRDWRRLGAASEASIEALKAAAPSGLPDSYLDLLRFTDGGEGPLPVQPFWFQLYPAHEALEIEQGGSFKEFFPNLFVVGGNGGGEAIALDLRGSQPFGVVAFDMTNIDLAESILPIAPTFDDMIDLIGRDAA